MEDLFYVNYRLHSIRYDQCVVFWLGKIQGQSERVNVP